MLSLKGKIGKCVSVLQCSLGKVIAGAMRTVFQFNCF